jgi:hypothetical protein
MHATGMQQLTPPSIGGRPVPPDSLRLVETLLFCLSPATICNRPLLLPCMREDGMQGEHSTISSYGSINTPVTKGPTGPVTARQTERGC